MVGIGLFRTSGIETRVPHLTNTGVMRVIDEGDSLRVITTSSEFHAKKVVYCLNAFSRDLLPELKGRIIPLRGQMVELEMRNNPPCVQPIIAGYGEIYWNFTANRLRFGGLEYRVPEEEVGIAIEPSPKVLAVQLKWIQENLEIPVGESVAATWCGTMGFTVDGFPFVGKLPGKENQYVLAGMCGLGHSYAMECASWLYEMIVNDKNVIQDYFSSDRIMNLPEFSGGNWRTLYEAWNH
jgi:glycine/D-amino acid oxidase-like deaminating enzyme